MVTGTEGDLPGVRSTRRRRNPPMNDNLEVQMKMVKSLLLGSAAGVVAVTGAQAADLPVKAKPVQYVKICTLYGDGFYYIPGSDTCIRFSGYVRTDYNWNGRAPHVQSSANGAQDRSVGRYTTRHRANLAVDTRTQTAYGTLRTFMNMYIENAEGTERSRTRAVRSSSGVASPSAVRPPSPTTKAASATPASARCTPVCSTPPPAPPASTRSPTRGSSATASP